MEIWQQLTATTVHVYVPRDLTAAFRRRLDTVGGRYRTVIADLQR